MPTRSSCMASRLLLSYLADATQFKKDKKNKSGESHLSLMKYSCVDASWGERWGAWVHQEPFVLIPAACRNKQSAGFEI